MGILFGSSSSCGHESLSPSYLCSTDPALSSHRVGGTFDHARSVYGRVSGGPQPSQENCPVASPGSQGDGPVPRRELCRLPPAKAELGYHLCFPVLLGSVGHLGHLGCLYTCRLSAHKSVTLAECAIDNGQLCPWGQASTSWTRVWMQVGVIFIHGEA